MSLTYAIHPGFVPADACAELIRVVTPYMRPAKVFTKDGELVESAARRADNCTINPTAGPAFAQLAAAIDKAVGQPWNHAEDFQFVRYGVGGGYDGHFDWHSEKTLARPTMKGGQRTYTAMIYLAAPARGGETRFPLLGLKVKPVVGTFLAWHNMDDNGFPNPWSWHEALPVEKGEKWIVTRWYKEHPVRE